MYKRQAFTLIELLVVISIISLLIAILLPALGRARDASQALKCGVAVKQMGMATMLYADDYKDTLPAVLWGSSLRWAIQLNPYMTNNSARGNAAIEDARYSPFFTCPSDNIARTTNDGTPSDNAKCSYGLSLYVHPNGIVANQSTYHLSELKSPSSTLLIGDRWLQYNRVVTSYSLNYTDIDDFHKNLGSNYLFADGHVKLNKTQDVHPATSDAVWLMP